MNRLCPNPSCACPTYVVRDGTFWRREDSKLIQRFRCRCCGQRFSSATFSVTYRQKKRRVNAPLLKCLSSGMSMRRAAIFLGINKVTVEKKLPFLAAVCRTRNKKFLKKYKGRIFNAQIDDLITKENSKLKPLSVSIAVDSDRRIILGMEVSRIPAFGHLSKLALKKYGQRKDEHYHGMTRLFQQITPILSAEVLIKSDEHNRYPHFIRAYLPQARHETFPSERGCIAGQGELKKVRFDPLFVVNHTCAQLRANVNRLIRKTWSTTKHPQRLKDHLDVFMYYHNLVLLRKALTPL